MPLSGTTHSHFIWLCTDGCGLTCGTITWTLHIFAWSTITKLVIIPWFGVNDITGQVIEFFYTLITFMALLSHAKAMFTNPGAVPQDAEPPPQDLMQYEEQGGWRKKRWCNRCKAFKPMRAHHDSVTGRCIVKLDHYCPWVNNAVGIFNHKFFLLFVLYTCIQCVFSITLLLFVFAQCASVSDHPFRDDDSIYDGSQRSVVTKSRYRSHSSSKHHHLRGVSSLNEEVNELIPSLTHQCSGLGALTALVLIEGILFGLFTLCMICDQVALPTVNII